MPIFHIRFVFVWLGAFALCLCAAPNPIIIAHRGASGYVPEHTLEAYAVAHAQGADYIEPDLVMTKDGVLICLHDIHLEATTNVEETYADRKRADGRWYAADFALDEIKRLRAHERLNTRFPQNLSRFDIPTFAEMIELVQGLNKTTGRIAGIYPELKEPAWHRQNGLPMEETFLRVMADYGYTEESSPVFVQCFEPEPLIRMRRELGSKLRQIQLMGNERTFDKMATDAGLAKIAGYADGIGPPKQRIEKDPALVELAHKLGLAVHPYTFRADSLPPAYTRYADEVTKFAGQYRIDGLFTDHPDLTVQALQKLARK
jgi:glycerophosphoryl diester phosphodiesterase